MDHDAVDTSVKRGTLREPGGYLLQGKGADGYTYYMAEALLDKVLGRLGTPAEKGKDGEPDTPEVKAYEVLETYKGSELEATRKYEPLYACAKEVADRQHKKGFRDLRHLRYDVRRYRNRSHRSCIR